MSATVQTIRDSITQMYDARERLLPHRTTDKIIAAIAQAAANWQHADYPWRLSAYHHAPGYTGFSEQMIGQILDLTFGALTVDALGELVDRELGNRRVLDEFCQLGRVKTRARGPRLITHVLGGSIPQPGIVSLCCGLLLRSANLVKVSSHDPIFPVLFVESLREVDPELAGLISIVAWSRDDLAVTQAAFSESDAVVAYGDDSTIATLRSLTGPQTRFIGYGHKASLAVIAKEAMTAEHLPALAEAAAFDASVYDQQGCLSPHVFYVEEGGELGPRRFALALSEAMAAYQARVPRGVLAAAEAAEMSTVLTGYQFRAQVDKRVAVWTSGYPTSWAVIYDDDPAFAPSSLNRLVFVKPTDGFKRVLNSLSRFGASISTVGIAPMHERAMGFANDLAKLGVHRVCPVGLMQRPPLTWHHDGRPNLSDLVHWMDIE